MLLWLIVTGLPSLAAQSADTSKTQLGAVVAQLPSAAHLRLSVAGERWSGRLAARSSDSLSLADETRTRTVRLAAIDTLWVRSPQRHRGLLGGAAFGALMFGAIQLGGGSSEDPGLHTRMGLAIFAGATVVGLLVDSISMPWERTYPTP
jgi:hypothetical protein